MGGKATFAEIEATGLQWFNCQADPKPTCDFRLLAIRSPHHEASRVASPGLRGFFGRGLRHVSGSPPRVHESLVMARRGTRSLSVGCFPRVLLRWQRKRFG